LDAVRTPFREPSAIAAESTRRDAMTIEQGSAEADLIFRVPRRRWIRMLLAGGFFLALAVVLLPRTGERWFATYWLVLGLVSVTGAWWRRRFALDLTPESANLRGLRWRSIPWTEVRAVVRHRRFGEWVVQLTLDSGEVVALRDPAAWHSFGDAEHELTFQRIEQWWLAHRAEIPRVV
jgi:hypothetical protein